MAQDCQTLTFVLYFGAFYLAAKLAIFLWHLLAFAFSRPIDVSRLGDWAVVTGATDGIGKAYARAIAARGLSVVLVSRSLSKLQKVAAEIEAECPGAKTKIIEVNFAKEDTKAYVPKLERELEGLNVGVLVNNVGMNYDPGEFLQISDNDVRDMVAVNIVPTNVCTRLVLPGMVSRGRGAIINVSSQAAIIPSPLLTVYAATKAYVDKFSANLDLEYRSKGITVQCLLPGLVVTNMTRLSQPTLVSPTPSTFVASAFSRLGVSSRTTGYWSHDIIVAAANAIPYEVAAKFVYFFTNVYSKKFIGKTSKKTN